MKLSDTSSQSPKINAEGVHRFVDDVNVMARRWRFSKIAATLFCLSAFLLGCGGGERASPEDSAVLDRSAAASSDEAQIDSTAESLSGSVLPEDIQNYMQPKLASAALPADTLPNVPTSQLDAVRLADQATFGGSEALLRNIRAQGPFKWIAGQMTSPVSRYSSGGTSAVHRHISQTVDFCANKGANCWRDWYSSTPLVWDFYRNAMTKEDQLRQRVALALQQILVVSNLEVYGTYGLRYYHNMFLGSAFSNYRTILARVARSPVMGDYLNNVNNDKSAPNENFARELLQLFSIGTCLLNPDGTLTGGKCQSTYDNNTVREYAYALTGWTYPAGGSTPWGCWPEGSNCQYYAGYMAPQPSFHDAQPRKLLAGVRLATGHTPEQALNAVLNSLMKHPNMGPFVGKQLIQRLVTSNPSTAYVQRVSEAFNAGQFQGFGNGVRGDMAATVAAILLDAEARDSSPLAQQGRLREPVLLFTGVLRALNGRTDGDALGWWWGETMRQHLFRSPSVFNFFPPSYPVSGTLLVGPEFAIHNTNTALERINFLNYLLYWGGSAPDANVPNALGTGVSLAAFVSAANDPAVLVDRLSRLALGRVMPVSLRPQLIAAVAAINQGNSGADYLNSRVRQAAYLIFASPQYQVAR
jgi:Protein of unknown function (DUF1800)